MSLYLLIKNLKIKKVSVHKTSNACVSPFTHRPVKITVNQFSVIQLINFLINVVLDRFGFSCIILRKFT